MIIAGDIRKTNILKAFIILLAITQCYGCIKNNDSLRIEIQVPPGDYDSLSYHLSKESFTAYSISGFTREYFDSTGYVSLDIETNRMGWLFITLFPNRYDNEIKNKSRVFLLARPGESYWIEYDSSLPLLFRITGDFEDAQNLYNQFNHSEISTYPRSNWNSNTDSLPTNLLAHLEDSIQNTLKPFQDLYNKKRIDDEYFKTIQTQIQYSHADALLDHLEIRQRVYNTPKLSKYFKKVTPLNLSQEDKIHIEREIFMKYPPANIEARIVPEISSYIDKYLNYKARLDFTYSFDNVTYSGRLEKVKKSSELFSDEIVEYYFAKQFGSSPVKQGPDSLATFLFPAFKDCYPESRYMPGIVRSIEGLTGYYAAFYPGLKDTMKSNEDNITVKNPVFSPDINFIQDLDSITTFDSLVSQFKGKNLFVDFWASWCPPCRYEFRFTDSLHNFLQAHDIEMLYISSDEDAAKWQNVIQNYNLKGYHYRVTNPELRKELRQMVDFIPTYMIVDSAGRIVVSEAERPHTKTILYNQLKESLNLLDIK